MRCAWQRTRRTTSTTCSRCAARSCATRTCGPPTSTRRSCCSPTRPTCCSPSTTGRAGATSGSSDFLAKQRDLYGYIHDQTLRLLNKGFVGSEIAEQLGAAAEPRARVALPRLLRVAEPQRQGRLPALPRMVRRQPGAPLAASARGGGRALRRAGRWRRGAARITRGEHSIAGDFRWVAEVVNHLVFADPDNRRRTGAPGAGARAARLRRRERDVAELLPHGRARAAHGPGGNGRLAGPRLHREPR